MRRLLLLAVLLVGCDSGPSYDQALQTWKTEAELLQSLKHRWAAAEDEFGMDDVRFERSLVTAKSLAERGDPEDVAYYKKLQGDFEEHSKKRAAALGPIEAAIAAQQKKVDRAKQIMDEAERRR